MSVNDVQNNQPRFLTMAEFSNLTEAEQARYNSASKAERKQMTIEFRQSQKTPPEEPVTGTVVEPGQEEATTPEEKETRAQRRAARRQREQEEIARLFPAHIRQALLKAHFDMNQVYEIRLRVNAPLILIYKGKEYFLTKEGNFSGEETKGCFVKAEDLKETMEYVSGYSMYAFEDEIRQGFITIQGGHRVGLAGKTVLEGDRIKSVKYIS